jgi:hypothetical protein
MKPLLACVIIVSHISYVCEIWFFDQEEQSKCAWKLSEEYYYLKSRWSNRNRWTDRIKKMVQSKCEYYFLLERYAM